jgi:arylsulfatase A
MFRETWSPAIKAGGYRDWQLFDLEADPSQKTNLAATEPAVLARLQVQLLKINASIMAEAADWHLPE